MGSPAEGLDPGPGRGSAPASAKDPHLAHSADGFEIKAGETLAPGDGAALKKWRELSGTAVDNCALLAPIARPQPLGAGLVARPCTLAGWDWLAQRA